MKTNDIRNAFVNYFKKQGHIFVKSSPVVPLDDPTLLFANAGMNQFKDIFLGKSEPSAKRATNYQKCIRASGKHNDLEDVGTDNFHHTFFEMLGNWSFGDYYKEEAIFWAWELLTREWALPNDKLYLTVYHSDDESFSLWKKITGFSEDKILKFGDRDNFWEMGEIGPCGPCTEIHIDLGDGTCESCRRNGHECGVNVDGCSRFIELWNLVFIQYNRLEDGSLVQLKHKHVDTGMGFERIARVLTGKASNYDIDIFKSIISNIEDITKKQYNNNNEVAMRVIADHIRALSFAITDGAVISNEGRNSVLRSILRRASRFGRTVLEQTEPFIYKLTDVVAETMGDAYPELEERKDLVKNIIKEEEITFGKTIDKGLEYFNKRIKELNKSFENVDEYNKTYDKINGNKKEKHTTKLKKIIPAKDIFVLHTQEGFPMDLTRQMAKEKGFDVDEDGFYKLMHKHKIASGAGDKFKLQNKEIDWVIVNDKSKSEFIGYTSLESKSSVLKYGWDGFYLNLVTDITPFYANMGGQVGDTGIVEIDKVRYNIIDTLKIGDDIIHIVDTKEKLFIKQNEVKLLVDKQRRRDIAKNHTATHLLHQALREVIGKHVTQQGSLVEPDKLRFDFSHKEKLSLEEVHKIETLVNEKIRSGLKVKTSIMGYEKAKKSGAMALFGEKYSEEVRVVSIDAFSKELCGGTHLDNIEDIGYFRIETESSIASGIRRIEATTGRNAFIEIDKERDILNSIKTQFGINKEDLVQKIENLMVKVKNIEKENKRLKKSNVSDGLNDIINQAVDIDNFKLVVWKFNEEIQPNTMREIGDKLKNKIQSCVLILASIVKNKINYVCMVTDNLVKGKKLNAGNIVREIAKIAGGGGGGKPTQATAGAKELSKLDESLSSAETIVKKFIK